MGRRAPTGRACPNWPSIDARDGRESKKTSGRYSNGKWGDRRSSTSEGRGTKKARKGKQGVTVIRICTKTSSERLLLGISARESEYLPSKKGLCTSTYPIITLFRPPTLSTQNADMCFRMKKADRACLAARLWTRDEQRFHIVTVASYLGPLLEVVA